jgi:hypothetical protein
MRSPLVRRPGEEHLLQVRDGDVIGPDSYRLIPLRTTSRAVLSSRRPMNRGWRSAGLVHSVKATADKFGLHPVLTLPLLRSEKRSPLEEERCRERPPAAARQIPSPPFRQRAIVAVAVADQQGTETSPAPAGSKPPITNSCCRMHLNFSQSGDRRCSISRPPAWQ